jgi:hypothetical protein
LPFYEVPSGAMARSVERGKLVASKTRDPAQAQYMRKLHRTTVAGKAPDSALASVLGVQ